MSLSELCLTAQGVGDPRGEGLPCAGTGSSSERRVTADVRQSLSDPKATITTVCYRASIALGLIYSPRPSLWDQVPEPVAQWEDTPAPVPEYVFDQGLGW